jgi:hypothetical protein
MKAALIILGDLIGALALFGSLYAALIIVHAAGG